MFQVAHVLLADVRRQALGLFPGTGLIANGPLGKTTHLLTRRGFGDVGVCVEFMIPKDGNSGVYLQGRYEVQILDSHGKAEDALFGKRYSSGDLEFENRHGQRGYGSGAAHYTTTFTLERGQPSVSADHFDNGRLFDVARWRIPPPNEMPWNGGFGRGARMGSATLCA